MKIETWLKKQLYILRRLVLFVCTILVSWVPQKCDFLFKAFNHLYLFYDIQTKTFFKTDIQNTKLHLKFENLKRRNTEYKKIHL